MAQPGLTAGIFLKTRYRVEYLVATGGYASVYRVTDMQSTLPRALKEVIDPDAAIREQFALEAQLLMRSRHPNIPRGHDHFEENDRAYLVMDYVEGNDLEQMLANSMSQRGRPVDEPQALRWMLPICDALYEMHSQPVPIIHRDIKPANIKLTGAGVPILIDFGLAKLGLPGPTNAAAQGVTPGYAPPEQYLAAGRTDHRSDIYSMGATLYTLLTGREPPEAPNRLLSQSGHTGEPMVPARFLNPSISASTAHIIDRAMSVSAAQRHQSARELQDELAAALHRIEYGRVPFAGGTQTGPLPTTSDMQTGPMPLTPDESYGATQRRTAVRVPVASPAISLPPGMSRGGSVAPTRVLSPTPLSAATTKVLPPPVWFNLGGPLVRKMGKTGLVLAAVELYWGLLCAAALGGAVGTSSFTHPPTLLVIGAAVAWLAIVISLTTIVVRAIDRPITRRGKLGTTRRWLQGLFLLLLWLAMNAVALLALGGASPVVGLFGLGFLGLASILTGLLSVANVLG